MCGVKARVAFNLKIIADACVPFLTFVALRVEILARQPLYLLSSMRLTLNGLAQRIQISARTVAASTEVVRTLSSDVGLR